MNRRRMCSVVAAFALLLGCAPLTMLYDGLLEWLLPAALAVFAVMGTSLAVRSLRERALLPELATFVALLLVCTWLYGAGTGLAGILPGPNTFAHFSELARDAGSDIRRSTIPLPASEGLVFLLVVAMGSVTILTDVFVNLIRESSLVGIPLLGLYVVPMMLAPNEVPWLLFIPGAVGFLWLLLTDNIDRVRRYGRRFNSQGHGVDRWQPSPLSNTGRWLAILVIPIALLLPAALPSFGAGLLANLYDDPDGQGGSRVAPWAALEGALDTPETTELGFVETDSKDPGYMKMWSASHINKDGFKADTQPSERARPVTEGIANRSLPKDLKKKRSRATFRATGLDDSALPLYLGTTDIDVGDQWVHDPRADTVTTNSGSTKDMSFEYSYLESEPTPDQLRSLGTVNTPKKDLTQTPGNQTVANLTKRITADAENSYDKVMAIQDHFSKDNGFSYDLRTEDGGSASAIKNFLKNKRGYCQQYAAAMGWMVREAGVSARVAIGLTQGAKTSNGYRLTNSNFHAWVEVYFDEYGWVPFDPTPSSGVDNSTEYSWAPDRDDSSNGDSNADPDKENGEGSNSDGNGSAGPGPGDSDAKAAATLSGVRPAPVWPYLTAGASLTAIVLFLPAMARAWQRRRRLLPGASTTQTATNAWQEFGESLRDLDVPVSRSDTPRRLAARAITEGGLTGDAAAAVRQLAAVAEHASYAPRAPEQLDLRLASRTARYGLTQTRSRWQQIRADLLPNTTLSAWSRALRHRRFAARNAMLGIRLRAGEWARRLIRFGKRGTDTHQ